MKKKHIAIMGQSRAGTTMFYNMMRGSLQGFQFLEHEQTAAQTIKNPRGSFCTKRPLDVFAMQEILDGNLVRKELDVILCVRDPRSLLTSKHKAVPDDYFMDADKMYFIDQARGVAQKTLPGLLVVDQQIRAILDQQEAFGYRVFLLRYEDLVANPDQVQTALSEQMGYRFSGSFSDFHKAAIPEQLAGPLNGIRPVDQDNAVKWQDESKRKRLIEQFSKFPGLFNILQAYGYEEGTDWFKKMLEAEFGDLPQDV